MNLRRLLRSRVVKTVTVIVVLAIAWQVYLGVTAPSRIDRELAEMVEQGDPVRVSVELNFAPERFHTLALQDYGRVMGVQDNVVQLRDVRASSVALLARIYWVHHITPLEEQR